MGSTQSHSDDPSFTEQDACVKKPDRGLLIQASLNDRFGIPGVYWFKVSRSEKSAIFKWCIDIDVFARNKQPVQISFSMDETMTAVSIFGQIFILNVSDKDKPIPNASLNESTALNVYSGKKSVTKLMNAMTKKGCIRIVQALGFEEIEDTARFLIQMNEIVRAY